jgi:hypothetical protein
VIVRLVKQVVHAQPTALVRVAAVLTFLALGLMVWSMLDPTPLPVMLAMSVGQLIGTMAFGLYGVAVVKDVLRIRRVQRESQELPVSREAGP